MIFIFDRNETDIIFKSAKAFINASDLNRIESNIEAISDEIGIEVVTGKTDWTVNDIPRVEDFARIIENTEKIRNGYRVAQDTPLTPVQPLNTYHKWNAIEKILYDVNMLYQAEVGALTYTTEMWTNDKIGVI